MPGVPAPRHSSTWSGPAPAAGYWGFWALVERGIYYVNARTKPQAIEFFEFATGRKIRIAELQKPLAEGAEGPGLAVSPDERWILYTQVDRWASDIMLVENFP